MPGIQLEAEKVGVKIQLTLDGVTRDVMWCNVWLTSLKRQFPGIAISGHCRPSDGKVGQDNAFQFEVKEGVIGPDEKVWYRAQIDSGSHGVDLIFGEIIGYLDLFNKPVRWR